MRSSFSSIAQDIENTKIKSVISDGLSYNEDLFKEIRKTLPRDLKIIGFTSPQKVPFPSFGKLIIPILRCQFYLNNNIATLLLKGWYLKNINVVESVKNKLIECGYEIRIPDFDSNHIILETLHDCDIVDNTEEKNIYFRPNGESVNGIKDIDATISAALLGWIPFNNEDDEDDEYLKINHYDNRINQPGKAELEKTGIVLSDKSFLDPKKMIIECENKLSVEEYFEYLTKQMVEDSKFFVKIVDLVKDDIVPYNDFVINRITEMNARLELLKKKIDCENIDDINSIKTLKGIWKKTVEKDTIKKESQEKISTVLDKVLTISNRKGKNPTYLESLFEIANNLNEQLSTPDCNKKEWFTKMIMQQHFLNFIIEAIKFSNLSEPDYEKLDNLLFQIKTEFTREEIDFYEPLSTDINRNNLIFSLPKSTDPKPVDGKEPYGKKNKENTLQIFPPKPLTPETTPLSGSKELETVNISVPATNIDSSSNEIIINPSKDEILVELPKRTEPIEFPSNGIKNNITEEVFEVEDRTILDLLDRNEPEIAYHLAKCYEIENKKLFLTSPLLANLFLSLRLRTPEGPIASMISTNISEYDLVFDSKTKGRSMYQLIFASILRPAVFAFNTSGAGLIYDEIQLGKLSELTTLKNMIQEFMNQFDGTLNFDTLSQIFDKAQIKAQQGDFFIKIDKWLEKAQASKFKGQPRHNCTQVFNNWVKTEGWLKGLLTRFINKKDYTIIKNLLADELEETSWKKKFDKEFKAVDLKGRNFNDRSDAIKWIKNQFDVLRQLLSEGLRSYVDHFETTSNSHDEVIEFVNNLKKEIGRILQLLTKNEEENLLSRISNKYLITALNNLLDVLSGNETGSQLDDNDNVFCAPLLKLSYYESGNSWEPKQYDNTLKKSILQFLESKPQTNSEILTNHLKNGNIEAYNRLLSYINHSGTEIDQIKKYDDFIGRFKFEFQNTITSIERGCSLGYLSDEIRTRLISSLEEVTDLQYKKEGINYPLFMSKIDNTLKEIETLKRNIILENEKLIPENINTSEKELLKSYLGKGNILVYNEILERINNGQYETFEESTGLLKHFFQIFLSFPNKNNHDLIYHALLYRETYSGADYTSVTEVQYAEAQWLLFSWDYFRFSKIQNNREDLENLTVLLENIGFNAPMFSENHFTKRKKSEYIDFKCNIIKGKSRSPIPQFGSIAKGSYRLVCIKQKLHEEDLIEEIKELTPDTDRAVIVFNFNWLSQQYRLEIARLSKKEQITSLLLDEAMLVYLFSIKGSKLPAFIKLATPFTFVEPYQTSSSNLSEEMFYGRSAQIQKLKNITGDFSCLIYGGRQLGKTVLQREVERVFHNPGINNYAKYIDLRNEGIGSWKPIEYISTVLRENLSFIPGLFPESTSKSIKLDALLSKTKEWFDKNKEARIILFLDESDRFLEQDAQNEWRHIVQLKGLMEKTNKRFKVILSGLHDVRRTNSLPNSPLAHFGNSICIGPMLDKEEAIEAIRLIKVPMETLGYEFETEDLVLMILSHCNWYPSLIQIFCSKLLNGLNTKQLFNQLPIIITDKDITKAYDKSKDIIKEKFNLTLSLDERYDLLANIIAQETIENPAIQYIGLTLEEITELAIIAWPAGFESTNTQIVVHNFLDEMVDLGILRLVSKANFALRTPNLRDLIGTCKQIKDNLRKTRSKPQEFKILTSRINYNPTGKRGQMCPIPAFYYDKLMDQDQNVLIIAGSKAGGIEHLEGFLTSQKKNVHLIYPELTPAGCLDIDATIETLEKRRITGVHNIIFVNYNVLYTTNDVLLIKEKIKRKSDLSVLFLMGSEQVWQIMSKNNNSFEKLENNNIPVFYIPQWDEDVAKDWFKETGCSSADMKEIFETTGPWHNQLDTYHSMIINNPEKWKDYLVKFEHEMLLKKAELLYDLGLNQASAIKIINDLIEFDGEFSKNEIVSDFDFTDNPLEAKNYLEYFLKFNLINNNLKVNPVLAKLIHHE